MPASAWPAADVLRLYRARWQAELLYKRMKQILDAHTIRARTAPAAEATVRALLLAWVLQERTSHEVRTILTDIQTAATMEDPIPDESAPTPAWLSSWLLATVSIHTLRHQVGGTWTAARLRNCVPRLARFLCTRRWRRQQETDTRRWLGDRLARVLHPQSAAA